MILRCLSVLGDMRRRARIVVGKEKIDGDSVFSSAPDRTCIQRLIFHESFSACHQGDGTFMNETWFNADNRAVVRAAWQSSSAAQASDGQSVECEVVIHVPNCSFPSGAYSQWSACIASLPPAAIRHEMRSPRIERVDQLGDDVRVVESTRGTLVQRKVCVSRHRVDIPDSPVRWESVSGGTPRANINVSVENDAVAPPLHTGGTVITRHKVVFEAECELWVLSLIGEINGERLAKPDQVFPGPRRDAHPTHIKDQHHTFRLGRP